MAPPAGSTRHRPGRIVGLLAGLGLATAGGCGHEPGGATGPSPEVGDTATLVIDNGAPGQTIDGFGASALSLVFSGGDYLGSFRAGAVKAAFGDVRVSVSTLQVGVFETPAGAADLWLQRANDNADPFAVNSAGFNFWGSDQIRERLLVPAAAFGYSDLTLGPLLNLRGPLAWLAAIRSQDYNRYLDEAAEHVLALLQYWQTSFGRAPGLVSLFNEPTSGNVELASPSAQEVVDLVKRIGARLAAGGFGSVKFLVPNEETIARSISVARAILADPDARLSVGAIGFHAYPYGSVYSSPRRILETSGQGAPDGATRAQLEELRGLGEQFGVPIWMTEVTEGPGRSDYAFDAMDNVLARATQIHDLFRYAGASAFFGMNLLWDSRTHAEHFPGGDVPFLTEQSGMVLIDLNAGKILITGMGYAVGHYARWLERGSVRIGAASDRPRVVVSAFRNPGARRIVVVAVNHEPAAQLLRVTLREVVAGSPVTGETSHGAVRWQAIAGFSPQADGEVTYVAPARSVVTLAIPY